MNGYIETGVVLSIVSVGIILGCLFAALGRPYWVIGYIIACIIIAILSLGRLCYPLNFIHPFDYILAGRFRFVLLGFATAIGLVSPMKRLPYRLERILVCVIMFQIVIWFSVMPFLVPALLKSHHASIKTMKSTQGICFQTTDYTCGPAAAVTALARLGIQAEEGNIAILAHSSPVIGTLPRCLLNALENKYSDNGLSYGYKIFKSVEDLKNADVTLAVVKESFFTDHCVAVLEVYDNHLLIADPTTGLKEMSFQAFAKIWRFSGITIKRS